MNMISRLRHRVKQGGSTEITAEEFDQLQSEWITRTRCDDIVRELKSERAALQAYHHSAKRMLRILLKAGISPEDEPAVIRLVNTTLSTLESEQLEAIKGTSTEVHNPIEYGMTLAAYLIAGANIWPWHKGYKELDEDQAHHLYGWEERGFLKHSGIGEDAGGDYKSPLELIQAVKEQLPVNRKATLLDKEG